MASQACCLEQCISPCWRYAGICISTSSSNHPLPEHALHGNIIILIGIGITQKQNRNRVQLPMELVLKQKMLLFRINIKIQHGGWICHEYRRLLGMLSMVSRALGHDKCGALYLMLCTYIVPIHSCRQRPLQSVAIAFAGKPAWIMDFSLWHANDGFVANAYRKHWQKTLLAPSAKSLLTSRIWQRMRDWIMWLHM